MIIFVYGAYFGLISSFFFNPRQAIKDEEKLGKGNYLSDVISMIGTLFLYVYWPSFNSALIGGGTLAGATLAGSAQMRAIINTYLSLSCSVIMAMLVSRITQKRLLNMELILNASLAGGVVMGCNAAIIIHPYGAMLSGFLTGLVASLGYVYLSPLLQKWIGLHDTCGVHNLFAMPGIIAGIISAIVAHYGEDTFKQNYTDYYLTTVLRAPGAQAGFQLAAIATSIGMGILGGVIGGLICGSHNPFFVPIPVKSLFDDRWGWWECVIDHHTLYNLKVKYELTMSMSRRSNFKRVITNIPETIADEQDLDNLNIERGPSE